MIIALKKTISGGHKEIEPKYAQPDRLSFNEGFMKLFC